MRSVAAGTVRHFGLIAAAVVALGGRRRMGSAGPEVRYGQSGSMH